jgi:uroporphyrinogen-III synthase
MPENSSLIGKVIAVPEARQLDILVTLLRNRGATVLELPLVTILDAPDPQPVLGWLRRFIATPPALFVLLTGEGLRRLLDLAGKHALQKEFVATLAGVRCLCRGPKPERVLRELSLKADIQALAPTTEGVIASLESESLSGQRVAVQLYGEELNLRLTGYLQDRGAVVDAVAPYIYAGREEEGRVAAFIGDLQRGKVDALTFTSQPQYKRLLEVATRHGLEVALHEGLKKTLLAAVGPVVAGQLEDAGYKVSVMPERTWFMKPLVASLQRHFEQAAAHPL